MLYMGQAGRLLEWANCIFVTLISYLGINAERQHWPSWANVNFLSSNLRSLSSSLSSHNHHPLMFMFIFMFNEHCSCWILWSPNKIPTNALLLSNELCLLSMVEPCKGGEGKTNKQKEVTDVDFSSLPWEHLGCLKRSTEAHFWGVLAFPITHFEPFEGDLRQRERERDWPQFCDLPWGAAGEKAPRCKIHFVQSSWLQLLHRLNRRQHKLSLDCLTCVLLKAAGGRRRRRLWLQN